MDLYLGKSQGPCWPGLTCVIEWTSLWHEINEVDVCFGNRHRFSPSHWLLGHFQHIRYIIDPGAQTMHLEWSPLYRFTARCVQPSLRSSNLVDFCFLAQSGNVWLISLTKKWQTQEKLDPGTLNIVVGDRTTTLLGRWVVGVCALSSRSKLPKQPYRVPVVQRPSSMCMPYCMEYKGSASKFLLGTW